MNCLRFSNVLSHLRRWLVVLAAGCVVALTWAFAKNEPRQAANPDDASLNQEAQDLISRSPLIQDIQHRGYISIGVRAYRRPSPDPEARPEADEYEMAQAHYFARKLGVQLKTLEMSTDTNDPIEPPAIPYDLALGISKPNLAITQSSTSQSQTPGGITILARPGQTFSASQTHGLLLVGMKLCAMQGSPYAQTVERDYGARIRYLPSTVASISAFIGRECDGVIAEKKLLDRLQQDESWSFYKQLPFSIQPAFGDQVLLAANRQPDIDAIHALLESWTHSEENQQRKRQRFSLYLYETSLIRPGAFCH